MSLNVFFNPRLKKIILFIAAALITSFLLLPTLKAQEDGSGYLQQIAENTLNTATAVNGLPATLTELYTLAKSWLEKHNPMQSTNFKPT